MEKKGNVRNIFIIGAKSLGQYGGFETFVDRLIEEHQNDKSIKYYVTCKANGDGHMDETKLIDITEVTKDNKDDVVSFVYKNAKIIKLKVPQIGPAQAIAYDVKAFRWCLSYISENKIKSAIIYVLACRIGPFFRQLVRKAHKQGTRVFVNPDGHEWKRAKWSWLTRKYWKESERMMVKHADLLICDSVNIEKYIKKEYQKYSPITQYIAYGADLKSSKLDDNDPKFKKWMDMHELKRDGYYICCGRFVPENSFEVMIREFMKSNSWRDFALITTNNDKYLQKLENKLHWKLDPRIKFVGTVYDGELLKKIREMAYGSFHGHTVGGTNPSLLEALGATKLNLLIDVSFNREVANDAALYWNKDNGNLAKLIDKADNLSQDEYNDYGYRAKDRIKSAYSWRFIGEEYKRVWENELFF